MNAGGYEIPSVLIFLPIAVVTAYIASFISDVVVLKRQGYRWRNHENVSLAEGMPTHVYERAYEKTLIFEKSDPTESIFDVTKTLIAAYGTRRFTIFRCRAGSLPYLAIIRHDHIIGALDSPITHRHQGEYFASTSDSSAASLILKDEEIISLMRMNRLSLEVCEGYLYVMSAKSYVPVPTRVRFMKVAKILAEMVIKRLGPNCAGGANPSLKADVPDGPRL